MVPRHVAVPNCGSVVRERAVALILREIMPDWRNRAINKSSPIQRELSARMLGEATGYVASHYFPGERPGCIVNGFRNENLERQSLTRTRLISSSRST